MRTDRDLKKAKSGVCEICGSLKTNRGSITSWIFRGSVCQCTTDDSRAGVGFKEGRKPSVKIKVSSFAESHYSNCELCGVRVSGLAHVCGNDSSLRPTSAERALIGKIINHKYKVEAFLGRGGMSVVYRARHLLLGTDVALKLLGAQLISDNRSSQRFQTEALAVSSLTHNNIIKLLEFGLTEDDRPFIATEFLTGSVLSELLEECGAIAPDVSLSWFCQIAEALVEAHSHGITHRDLKPSNVMIGTERDGSETVKLLDFGIAKVVLEDSEQSKLTQTGEIFGSPIYMSPEQCLGQIVDHRTDVYSLGVLMYEILSGKPPICGENVLDTIRKQLTEEPRSVSELAPDVSEDLEYIVMRCLDKDPSWRYQSAKELLSDLRLVKARKKIRKVKKGQTAAAGEGNVIGSRDRSVALAWIAMCLVALIAGGLVAWQLKPVQKLKESDSSTRVSAASMGLYNDLSKFANQLEKDGNFRDATTVLMKCVDIANDIGDNRMIYESWRKAGRVATQSKNYESAAACFRNAFYVYIKLNAEDQSFLEEFLESHLKVGTWYKHLESKVRKLKLSESNLELAEALSRMQMRP